jgi:hypothetical protein
MLRECEYSFLLLHELTYQRRNILRCRIQREMTTIDNVEFGTGHISPVRLRLRGVKRPPKFATAAVNFCDDNPPSGP